jgi:hypothetical protein
LDEVGLAGVGLGLEALHLATTVAGVWIPLAARLTPANEADSRLTPKRYFESYLLRRLASSSWAIPTTTQRAPEVRELCEAQERILVASLWARALPARRRGGGRSYRRIFHELRWRAIENFNGQFKSIFGGNAQVPTKGKLNTARFALLGAIFSYTNWPCSTSMSTARTCALGSKPFSRQREL